MFRLVLPTLLAVGLLSACSSGDDVGTGAADVRCTSGCTDGTVDFGVVPIGERAERVLLLVNRGEAKAALREIPWADLAGGFDTDLACTGGACDTHPLQPGASITVRVGFRPSAAAPSEATLSFGAALPALRLRGVGGATSVRCAEEVDFGTVVRNEIDTRTLGCTNEGTVDVDLLFGEPAGAAAADFDLSGQRTYLLRPGETATVSVSMRGSGGGVRSAYVPVRARGEEVARVALQATSVDTALRAAHAGTCLELPMQQIGLERFHAVEVENVSDEPVQITATRFAAESAPGFAAASEAALHVGPGERQLVPFSFRPAAAGRAPATFLVESDDPGDGLREFCIVGQGGGPELACEPASLDFAVAPTGFSRTLRLHCSNVGVDVPDTDGDRLQLEPFVVEGPFQAALVGQQPQGGYAPGERFAIDVTFAPVAEGPAAGTLRLPSNDVGGATVQIPLVGLGRDVRGCVAELSATELDFGRVWREDLSLDVTLHNTGTGLCMVRAPARPGGDKYTSTLDGTWAEVPAGGSLLTRVTFAPQGASGTWESVLALWVSEAGNEDRPIALRATSGSSCLKARPGSLTFDGALVGPGCTEAAQEVRLLNECATPVEVDTLDLLGAEGGFALVDAPSLPVTIPGRDALSLYVSAVGPVGEEVAGALRIATDATDEPVVVPLYGWTAEDSRHTDRFGTTVGRPLDVLLVVDNSTGSEPEFWLHPETFLNGLAGFDYHLGVTSTGVTPGGACPGGANGQEDGRLFPVDGSSPRIITPALAPAARIDALWANTHVGICHFDEQGLEATRRALSSPTIDHADDPRYPQPNDGNLGFLREDADLAVLVHSDEWDQSPAAPEAYARFLRGLKDDPRRVRFHAIVGDPVTGCSGLGNAAQNGDRYVSVVDATGGTFHSLCSQSAQPAFSASVVEGITTLARCYELSAPPGDLNGDGALDAADIEVFWNGARLPAASGLRSWRFDTAKNAVCFTNTVSPGTAIEITYQPACLPLPN